MNLILSLKFQTSLHLLLLKRIKIVNKISLSNIDAIDKFAILEKGRVLFIVDIRANPIL